MADEYEKALGKLMGYIDQMVGFSKEQLPDVAKEILLYGAQMNAFWLTVWGILAGIGVFALILGYLNDEDGQKGFGFFAMIVGGVFASCCWVNLIQIETAPKLYVLGELKSILPSCSK